MNYKEELKASGQSTTGIQHVLNLTIVGERCADAMRFYKLAEDLVREIAEGPGGESLSSLRTALSLLQSGDAVLDSSITCCKKLARAYPIPSGERIMRALQLIGWNQVDLAKEVSGVSQGRISNYLNGRDEPRSRNLYKIRQALEKKRPGVWEEVREIS